MHAAPSTPSAIDSKMSPVNGQSVYTSFKGIGRASTGSQMRWSAFFVLTLHAAVDVLQTEKFVVRQLSPFFNNMTLLLLLSPPN